MTFADALAARYADRRTLAAFVGYTTSPVRDRVTPSGRAITSGDPAAGGGSQAVPTSGGNGEINQSNPISHDK